MKKTLILLILLYSIVYSQNVNDPLISGSLGQVNGGTFTSEGWKTNTALDYIQYDVPTITSGVVEFDVKGIYASNTVFPNYYYDKYGNEDQTIEDVHYQLINFWDRDDDNSWWGQVINGIQMWHNPFKMLLHFYGYTPGDLFKWKRIEYRLNVCAWHGAYEDDSNAFSGPLYGPFEWDKDTTYHHKLTWGNGHFKWYMNGVLISDRDYSSFGCEYAPDDFSIRLGSAILGGVRSGGLKSPIGITYSNFKFYETVDITPPAITEIEYTKEEEKVSVTSDVLITFNKPMDEQTIRTGILFTPAFANVMEFKGNTVCIRNTSVLQSNTEYQMLIDGNIKDLVGHSLGSNLRLTFRTNKTFPDTLYLYQSHDFPLVMQGINYNTLFSGHFQTEGRIIDLEGFWDNYSIGKIRFTPDKTGTWTYNINGIQGSFVCVETMDRGFIKTNGTNFQYANGESWHWLGDTAWRLATNLHPYNGNFKTVIDKRSLQDYTAIQFILHSYINGNPFWSNEGGQCFSGTEPDYNNLNPEYFRWVDRRINYALGKGLVPVIFFTWAQDFGMFSSEQFNKYVRYIVARYAAKNVVWIICGEYNEIVNDFPGRITEEFNTWGVLIRAKDPYKHLISLHPSGRGTSAEFANMGWMDFIGQQTPYAARDILRDLVYGKPVVNLEPVYYYPDEYGSPTTTEEARKALYEIAQAGGYFTSGFYTTYAPDKFSFDLSALPEEQYWTMILNRLIKNNQLPSTYEEYLVVLEGQNIVPNKVKGLRIVE